MPQTEFFTHNLDFAFSKDFEAAINTLETGNNDYLRTVLEGNAPALPQLAVNDGASSRTGSGSEFESGAANTLLSDYFDPVRIPVGDLLSAELGGALWHMALSGAVTTTPQFPAPTLAPVPTEGAAGTLAAGTYQFTYAWRNATGVTTVSPIGSVTITASKQINLAAVTPLPSGITSVDWFMSDAAGSTTRKFIANNNGAAFSVNALPAGGAAAEPTSNTASQWWDHTFGYQLDSVSLNLLSRSAIQRVGGIQYVYGGVVVDEYGVTWDGNEFPKFMAGLVGSGYHKPLSDYPSIVLPTLESQVPFQYLNGFTANGSVLEWNGAAWGGVYNAAASGRFMGFSFSHKNNVRLGSKERQPNDPILTRADGSEGGVQNRMRRGKRNEATLRVTLRLDNQDREEKAQRLKQIITGFKIVFPGAKIGTTSARFEWELQMPKSRVAQVTPDEMDGEEVLHIDFKPYKDSVTGGLFTGRVRNNVASGIIAPAA